MAEELIQGGVSWWNSPLNLFNSSPCSSAYNEIGSLDWPSHDLMTNIKTVRSGDDSGGSASEGSSSAAVQDFHQPDRHWNQEFVSDCGRSEDNYSKFLLDNYHDLPTSNSNNFSEDPSIQTLQSAANSDGFLLGPYAKRPRIGTLSPLPTFKVRKEKMGDRITALQQLVSPFGKTDTASVLHEAIEYIKFLHDQVNALSTPYVKYATPPATLEQVADKPKDQKGLRKDLKTRGLCLVPVSSSFPVAPETTNINFWTPTFGGSFK